MCKCQFVLSAIDAFNKPIKVRPMNAVNTVAATIYITTFTCKIITIFCDREVFLLLFWLIRVEMFRLNASETPFNPMDTRMTLKAYRKYIYIYVETT